MKKFSIINQNVLSHPFTLTDFIRLRFFFPFFGRSAVLVTIIILVLERSLFPVAQRGESFKYSHVNYIKVESI